ncbi:dCTP deaminase, partial [Roseateles chitinivorans]|uniref:dCTP deaminase n=1 Tax=Roseateles chitinivorans TaxID=2917965 RepID=UPI003F61E5DA
MILSDRTLKHALHDRDIQIVPPIDQATQLDCCGIYGTLGKEFRVQQVNPDAAYIDPRNAEDMGDRWVLIEASDDDPFILEPDAFVLAATKEQLTIPHDMVAFMDGRT